MRISSPLMPRSFMVRAAMRVRGWANREEHQVVVPVFEDLVLDQQVAQGRDGLRGRVAGHRSSGLGRGAPAG